jgi:aminopeptidase N
VKRQFSASDNMTDVLGALKAAQHCDKDTFDELMSTFETKWHHDSLVMDKWFGLNATYHREDILAHIDKISGHPQFSLKNPNRVRSLIGSFAFYNPLGFHNKNGEGYHFLTDYLMKLDDINPQATARIVTPLTQWRHLDEHRQGLMKSELKRLLNKPKVSADLFEKVTKSLS